MAVPPYRIEAKVKNNRLWRAVQARWPDVRNQSDAAQRLHIGGPDFGNLLNMRVFPGVIRDGKIRYWQRAIRIAELTGTDIDYLFDHKLYGGQIPGRLIVEVGLEALVGRHLRELPMSPEAEALDSERKALLRASISQLSPREQLIIDRSFGLGDAEEGTLRDIAAELGLSVERTRQVKRRALGKLRHPKLTRELRSLYRE
jgi:RNA polymerase sigma factor (sigma-70 family)